VLTMRVWVLLHHLNVLLKDPIYHNLYITHSHIVLVYNYVNVVLMGSLNLQVMDFGSKTGKTGSMCTLPPAFLHNVPRPAPFA